MEKIIKELFDYSSEFKEQIGSLEQARDKDGLLIWQYVRFNPQYQKDFKSAQAFADTVDNEYAADIFSDLGRNWALYPYAIDPSAMALPTENYFQVKTDVKSINVRKILADKMKRDVFLERLRLAYNSDGRPAKQLLISVNPMADKKSILSVIEKIVEDAKSEFLSQLDSAKPISDVALKARGTTNLVEHLCAYYLTEQLTVSGAKAITEKMGAIIGLQRAEPFQDQHIERMVERFKKVSSLSPWCFFLKPN